MTEAQLPLLTDHLRSQEIQRNNADIDQQNWMQEIQRGDFRFGDAEMYDRKNGSLAGVILLLAWLQDQTLAFPIWLRHFGFPALVSFCQCLH